MLAHLPCCGPVVLVAIGGASTGAGWLGGLEKFRYWFLGASLLQLAVGFYMAYRRPHRCKECAHEQPDTVKRFETRLMWVVAAFVLAVTIVGFAIDPHAS